MAYFLMEVATWALAEYGSIGDWPSPKLVEGRSRLQCNWQAATRLSSGSVIPARGRGVDWPAKVMQRCCGPRLGEGSYQSKGSLEA